MKIIGAFGDFLWHDTNTAKAIIKQIPDSANIKKINLPVGYFKKSFIKPIKKYNPKSYIILGMWKGKCCKIETVANNKKITLKNPFLRTAINIYSHILKILGKNLRITKPIPKEKLKIILIEKNASLKIRLNTKPLKIKNIKISQNSGNYVCNYAIWVIERYLQKNNLKTRFCFLHLPKELNKKQEKAVLQFIKEA